MVKIGDLVVHHHSIPGGINFGVIIDVCSRTDEFLIYWGDIKISYWHTRKMCEQYLQETNKCSK